MISSLSIFVLNALVVLSYLLDAYGISSFNKLYWFIIFDRYSWFSFYLSKFMKKYLEIEIMQNIRYS